MSNESEHLRESPSLFQDACVFAVEGGRSGGDRAGRTEAVIAVAARFQSNDDRRNRYFQILFAVLGSYAPRASSVKAVGRGGPRRRGSGPPSALSSSAWNDAGYARTAMGRRRGERPGPAGEPERWWECGTLRWERLTRGGPAY